MTASCRQVSLNCIRFYGRVAYQQTYLGGQDHPYFPNESGEREDHSPLRKCGLPSDTMALVTSDCGEARCSAAAQAGPHAKAERQRKTHLSTVRGD